MKPISKPTSAEHAESPDEHGRALVSELQRSDIFRVYQHAFETTTGLPLALRAPGAFQSPLHGSKRLNPFCALMARSNKSCAACLQLQQQVETEAVHEPKTIECFAGLSESAVPVRVGEVLVGYLQTGQVFLRPPTKKRFNQMMREVAPDCNGAELEERRTAYFRTRAITTTQYDSIIRLLSIFAQHLATISNQIFIREATTELPAISKVRAFITEHQSEELNLNLVARAAGMSAFYFCKLFRKSTGLTFTDYLARRRIESVKLMLLNVNTHISEAAYAAGFQSLSQFNRVFRRIAGEAPTDFRDGLHSPSHAPFSSIHKN